MTAVSFAGAPSVANWTDQRRLTLPPACLGREPLRPRSLGPGLFFSGRSPIERMAQTHSLANGVDQWAVGVNRPPLYNLLLSHCFCEKPPPTFSRNAQGRSDHDTPCHAHDDRGCWSLFARAARS